MGSGSVRAQGSGSGLLQGSGLRAKGSCRVPGSWLRALAGFSALSCVSTFCARAQGRLEIILVIFQRFLSMFQIFHSCLNRARRRHAVPDMARLNPALPQ